MPDPSEKPQTPESEIAARVAGIWIKRVGTRDRGDGALEEVNEYLLSRRTETDPQYPGQIGLLMKTMNPVDSDDYFATAERGTLEELGHTVEINKIKFFTLPQIYKGEGTNIEYSIILVEIIPPKPNDPIIMHSQGEQIMWMTKQEMLEQIKNEPESFLPEMQARINLLVE